MQQEAKFKPRGNKQSLLKTYSTDAEYLGNSGKKKKASYLCFKSGIFTEDCGLVHIPSQASRNKDECLGVFHKSLMS